MKYFAVAASLIAVVAAQAMTINTPMSVVQCQPVYFSWTGGAPSYYLSLIPGGQPGAQALESFDKQDGDSMTWVADQPAGTSMTAALKDSTGQMAYTDKFVVRDSPDKSCIKGSASSINPQVANTSSPAVAETSTRPLVAITTSASRVTSQNAAVSTSRTGTTTTATSASASTLNKSGAESLVNIGSFGMAGALGLAGAMLL